MEKTLKSAIFLFFACLLPTVGCSSRNPHTFNSATSTSSPKQLALDSEKTSAVEARLAFVKKQMSAHGYNPNLLIDGDDLYSLMLAVQNGKLTSEMLRGKHFFFKDNIGIDYGL